MEWNRVTWYSKIIALVLFVALPFIGFYYGIRYGESIERAAQQPSQSGKDYYANVAAWQTDRNDAGGFSIAYPLDFNTQDNAQTPSTDWRLSANGTPGIRAFTLQIPRAFEPQTNFADATLTVGRSGNNAAVKQCTSPDTGAGESSAALTATSNGIQFSMFHSSGAGAGNFYETTSYRTLHGGQCYVIEYTVHSTQIMNYPAEYQLQPFDRARVLSTLDRIVGTFKFL